MHKVLIFFILFFSFDLLAQTGGTNSYTFFNTPLSARLAVLNQPLAIYDNDANVAILNPSMLNVQKHGVLSMNVVDYYADINFLEAAYVFPIKELGTFSTSLKAVSYGNFVETDINSNVLGSFRASEQIFSFGYGLPLGYNFNAGIQFKFLLSDFAEYQSSAVASDIALSYYNPKSNWSFSVLSRNIGRPISDYTDSQLSLPFVIDLGVSKTLEHLPFRFHLGYHDFQSFDNTFQLTNTNTSLFNEETVSDVNFGNKLFNHFSIGGELTLAKRIDLRFGYNAQRRRELQVSSYQGTVGFSWGLGIRLNSFIIDFGRVTNHLNGSPNYFSIRTNLNKIISRK
jgi:hypothetical protein